MQVAAGDQHFSEASLVNQDSHGLNLTLAGNGGQYSPPPNQSCWPLCNQEVQLKILPIKSNIWQAKSLWLHTWSLCSFWKLRALKEFELFIMLDHQYLMCTSRVLAPIVDTTHGESAWSSYHSKCLCNRFTTTLPISPCVSLCFCATSSYERRLSFHGQHTIRSIQTLGMSPQKIPWGCCRSFVGKALCRERERERALAAFAGLAFPAEEITLLQSRDNQNLFGFLFPSQGNHSLCHCASPFSNASVNFLLEPLISAIRYRLTTAT